MDACLIALIKIHAARRGIGLAGREGDRAMGWVVENRERERGREREREEEEMRRHVYSNGGLVLYALAKGNGTRPPLSARPRLRGKKK